MIINGKQVKNIFHNGKQVQKVIRNGVTLYSGQHPNMVARYSARGKTNSDADRDILKDLSGNGRDIVLKNFAFTIDSGYENPLYPGGLVFDGVDDYGICDNFTIGGDYTVLVKRKWFSTDQRAALLSKASSAVGNNGGEFVIEASLAGTTETIWYIYSYLGNNNSSIRITKDTELDVIVQTRSEYNDKIINYGAGQPSKLLLLGKRSELLNFYYLGVVYDLIIYNKTLTEQEIQSEILKYNL